VGGGEGEQAFLLVLSRFRPLSSSVIVASGSNKTQSLEQGAESVTWFARRLADGNRTHADGVPLAIHRVLSAGLRKSRYQKVGSG